MEETMYDVTIVGAGPVGLFTAFYAGMRQMSVKVIDSMPEPGGQLSALYPEKYIYDVAGYPKVKAQSLVDQLYEQAQAFDPTMCMGESVEHVTRFEDGTFQLVTPEGVHHSKTIIVTAGAGAFSPRKLTLEQAEAYENSCLHYFVKDLKRFQNRRVLVCGGGDSAVDWALALNDLASEVTLIHRRDRFRAHEHSLEQLKQSNVNIRTPYEISGMTGENGAVQQVTLQQVKGDAADTLDVDDILVNFGFATNLGPLKTWGMELSKNAIAVDHKMETTIPGIFAAGDVCTYPGKVKLIASGFGEAPTAVNYAKSIVEPEAKLHAGHSTSIFETAGV
ncbi:NAD(P)/FAD-dependent oxidoreductase [Alkalicoccus urumqiensis]|uniref:Ferredoxin--NADP reductase n=1 Tax=Alkalicoccus urumqiensis TaxID=1548213 RepID=A0A2P6MDY8_ALKUR|nr:NAD(P)/FAD-dependent oxidoreductase [Alkalicoccus urumqiensis]PRO64498.1 ferredoxin--NADP(+) reductase [Alkalicoccus urumqiensis]